MIAIVGPTAAGKSELALFLAERLDGEIVNCDSVQVHVGLDIGSAKTPIAQRRGIRHHLIDVVPVTEELSAGSYANLARAAISCIHERGKLPVVVGGTGFYLRALFEGLSPAPGRDPQLRSQLQELQRRRPGILHRFLRRFDSAAARRIHPNDTQKLIRAVELVRLVRQPVSTTQRAPRSALGGARVLKIGLHPERVQLVERIQLRSALMFDTGLIQETQNLLNVTPDAANCKALRTLGYRQAVAYLRNECSLEEAIAQTQLKTKQYAKRQLTWFRSDSSIQWIRAFGTEPTARRQALEWCTHFLSTCHANCRTI